MQEPRKPGGKVNTSANLFFLLTGLLIFIQEESFLMASGASVQQLFLAANARPTKLAKRPTLSGGLLAKPWALKDMPAPSKLYAKAFGKADVTQLNEVSYSVVDVT